MNTKNNKRKKESQLKIERAFIELLQDKEVSEISVTDICKHAQCNRTTFYSSYLDIYDLLDKIADKMIHDFHALYADEENSQNNSNDFTKLFSHIKENQLFYKAYFKLGLDTEFKIARYDTLLAVEYYDNQNLEYHMAYFRAGITAIIKMWLQNSCDLSPEALFDIIKAEYQGKEKIKKM